MMSYDNTGGESMTSHAVMCSVPSMAPGGLMVIRSPDGLSMNISWSPLMLSQARGYVNYVIIYEPVGNHTGQTQMTANGTYIVVSSLNATAKYFVTICGLTSVGLGPSASVTSSGRSRHAHSHALMSFVCMYG